VRLANDVGGRWVGAGWQGEVTRADFEGVACSSLLPTAASAPSTSSPCDTLLALLAGARVVPYRHRRAHVPCLVKGSAAGTGVQTAGRPHNQNGSQRSPATLLDARVGRGVEKHQLLSCRTRRYRPGSCPLRISCAPWVCVRGIEGGMKGRCLPEVQ